MSLRADATAIARRRVEAEKRAKAKCIEAMRELPVGSLFLLCWWSKGPLSALYEKHANTRVRCVVDSTGKWVVENRSVHCIDRPGFIELSYVISLIPDGQSRRLMLAHHGLGMKAIAR